MFKVRVARSRRATILFILAGAEAFTTVIWPILAPL